MPVCVAGVPGHDCAPLGGNGCTLLSPERASHVVCELRELSHVSRFLSGVRGAQITPLFLFNFLLMTNRHRLHWFLVLYRQSWEVFCLPFAFQMSA